MDMRSIQKEERIKESDVHCETKSIQVKMVHDYTIKLKNQKKQKYDIEEIITIKIKIKNPQNKQQ